MRERNTHSSFRSPARSRPQPDAAGPLHPCPLHALQTPASPSPRRAPVPPSVVRASLAGQDATGTLPEPSRITGEEYLPRWLKDAARPALRDSTFALYAMVIRKHILPHIGTALLSRLSLSPANVQTLLSTLERDTVPPPTRKVVLRVLHVAFKQAVAWRLITSNPAVGVKPPRVPQREMQTLTPELARQFLEAAKSDRFHALYAVLLGTGLRIGEALGLSWTDVDLERGTLTVRRQLTEVSGKLSLQEPKTERARRTVDLPGFVVEALREHEERMRAEKHLLTDLLLVFVGPEGKPLRKSNLRRRSFVPLLKRAGIRRVRVHDIRHTAASLMLLEGVHPKVVQERLGHANIGITLGIYSHVLPRLGKEAAEKMDALLNHEDRVEEGD